MEDKGDVISAYGQNVEKQAEIAVKMAVAKGWKLTDLDPSGCEEWVQAIANVLEKKGVQMQTSKKPLPRPEPKPTPTPQPTWNERFKKASAARKAAAKPAPVKGSRIQDARAVDPTQVFQKYGYTVRQEGRHLSVMLDGDEAFRSTLKDGHWVHCDHYENGIGDNIALVQHLDSSKSFPDAVFELHGAPAFNPQPAPDLSRMRPKMPTCHYPDIHQGQAYLQERGISPKVIDQAEKAGFLTYTKDAVLTLGRDQNGEIRAAIKRSRMENTETPKRDLRYTDKVHFPPILPGDPSRVTIVEGGIDALAVQTFCEKRGEPAPTVIVTGSAKAQGFLEQPHIQQMLTQAERVTVCYENEPKPSVQEKTDKSHDRQVARIQDIVAQAPQPVIVQQWRPPAGDKDVADTNKRALTLEQERRKREESARQQRFRDHQKRGELIVARRLAADGYDEEEIQERLQPQLEKSGWHKRIAASVAALAASEAYNELEPKETFALADELREIELAIQEAEKAEQEADQTEQEAEALADKAEDTAQEAENAAEMAEEAEDEAQEMDPAQEDEELTKEALENYAKESDVDGEGNDEPTHTHSSGTGPSHGGGGSSYSGDASPTYHQEDSGSVMDPMYLRLEAAEQKTKAFVARQEAQHAHMSRGMTPRPH